jgi:hypothetical protein
MNVKYKNNLNDQKEELFAQTLPADTFCCRNLSEPTTGKKKKIKESSDKRSDRDSEVRPTEYGEKSLQRKLQCFVIDFFIWGSEF